MSLKTRAVTVWATALLRGTAALAASSILKAGRIHPRLRTGALVALAAALMAAVAMVACAQNSYSIVQTSNAEARATAVEITAVAKATLDSGGCDISTIACQLQATRQAGETATAEALAKGGGATPTTASGSGDEAPAGPAESGQVTVEVSNGGEMDPAVLKITVGTTVTWENIDPQSHNIVSDPSAPEEFKSGRDLYPVLGSKEHPTFSHTFNTEGKYIYGSKAFGDTSTAVIWVVSGS